MPAQVTKPPHARSPFGAGRVVHADAEPEKGFYYRSDHFNFAKQGVPALDPDGGVDYIGSVNRFHVVYNLTSMTYRRQVRLETSASLDDPHVPSVTGVYPGADWQERETYDMFGVIFDGHPALTRILMPDDWDGYPQRKDYPLGGIPVQYKGATIPPPDERRAYR